MPEFNDELDKLSAALRDAPAPDVSAKDAALRVAEENFARLQETDPAARPTQTSPKRGSSLKGLGQMFMKPNLKPLMLATSSLVIVGVGVVLVSPLTGPAPQPVLIEASATLEADGASQAVVGTVAEEVTPSPPHKPTAKQVSPQTTTRPRSSADALGLTNEAEAALPRIHRGPFLTPSDELNQARPFRDQLPQPQLKSADDRFANAATNPTKVASEEPVSTFSIDVDTASYSWVRSSLMRGQMPDSASVRVEEMVNYFPYTYPTPTGGLPFETSVSVSQTPWNPDTQLMHIAIQGAEIEDRPPLNLVFLIDTSGSMQDANKLPLLIQSFRLMLGQLRPEDQVAIVTYAGSAGTVLEPTAAANRTRIEAALARLSAGGSTAGGEGLRAAYNLAEQMSEDGDVSRVILATDGDFNVGLQSDAALKGFVTEQRKSGTYLSVLGFGRGNVNDALMQTLAQNGNGQAAYIDTLAEAQKMLVDQLSGALFPIAQDVKIQVEFNPATVAEYRLIGYETRALRREDFNNDKVDAGEIGAGHTVTALYEVTPVGSPAARTDPLRFGTVAEGGNETDLAFLRLRYKAPGAAESQLLEEVITVGESAAGPETQFAAAVAGFGQLLHGSTDLGDWSYNDAIALANGAKGEDPFGYRAEAVQLMRLAESLGQR